MSFWLWLIIGFGVSAYGTHKNWSFKKIAIVGIAILFAGAIIDDKLSSSYDEDGYRFALNHLNSPSTATLLKAIPKGEFTDMIKDNTTFKIPDNLEFEYYKIESTNVFGGRLAKDFVVFFWNGDPIYMEEDGGECFSSPQNWMATKLAIKDNTGIDIDQ